MRGSTARRTLFHQGRQNRCQVEILGTSEGEEISLEISLAQRKTLVGGSKNVDFFYSIYALLFLAGFVFSSFCHINLCQSSANDKSPPDYVSLVLSQEEATPLQDFRHQPSPHLPCVSCSKATFFAEGFKTQR